MPGMSKTPMRIAITGSIASGKSTVAKILRDEGITVFDCDKCAHELLEANARCFDMIVKAFPDAVISGVIDRKRLASIVFNDTKKLRILNNIMHPLIKEMMLEQSEGTDLFIAEVPILFEAGWQDLFDRVLVVCSKEDKMIERLIKKGYTEKEVIARIANQMDIKAKIALADDVIYNNGDLAGLKDEVDKWFKRIRNAE